MLGVLLTISSAAVLVIVLCYRGSIVIVSSSFRCDKFYCKYEVVVKNISSFKKNGYILLNAFHQTSIVRSSQVSLAATKKIEFSLEGEEVRRFIGRISSENSLSRVQISAGEAKGKASH